MSVGGVLKECGRNVEGVWGGVSVGRSVGGKDRR